MIFPPTVRASFEMYVREQPKKHLVPFQQLCEKHRAGEFEADEAWSIDHHAAAHCVL